MRVLYSLLAYLLTPVMFGIMLWRGLRERGYWSNLHERFGFGAQRSGESCVWVHAASVGEINAAAVLIRALLARYSGMPLVITTMTPTGAQLACSLFGDAAQVRFVPFDLPGSVRRFFGRVRPRIAVIMETELWPNLYRECQRRGIPLMLASARISPRSEVRYRRLSALFQDTLSRIVIAAQTDTDARRFLSIGASPSSTHVIGNLKFDFDLPDSMRERGRQLREFYAPSPALPRFAGEGDGARGIAAESPPLRSGEGSGRGRFVWIAGSTHPGEEEQVLDAHAQIRKQHPDALLILVPRHRDRFDTVAQLLKRRGVSFVTRSSSAAPSAQTEVLLIDTLGELVGFYAASDIAFVGGSLVPIGGHNLLEPAALSLPILAGPHNFNGPDIAKLLTETGAMKVVSTAAELAGSVGELMSDENARAGMGARGKQAVDANRGALDRVLGLIDCLLQAAAAPGARAAAVLPASR